MNEEEKLKIMSDTLKPINDLIDQRLQNRLDMLATLGIQPLESNIPESVKKMREEEASKIRAIVQELRDLKAIIKAVFPTNS